MRLDAGNGTLPANNEATYEYQSGSSKLDAVNGFVPWRRNGPTEAYSPRNLSKTGGVSPFVYDETGGLIQDKSKDLWIRRDQNGREAEFYVRTPEGLVRSIQVYDAGGQRSSKLVAQPNKGPEFVVAAIDGRADFGDLSTAFTRLQNWKTAGTLVRNTQNKVKVYVPVGTTATATIPTGLSGDVELVEVEEADLGEIIDQRPIQLAESQHYFGWGERRVRYNNNALESEELITYLPEGLGERRARSGQAAATEIYVKDHLGSTRVSYEVTAPAGSELVSSKDYEPYGFMMDYQATANEPAKTFTGKEWDDEASIGLFYFGARFYDPVLGVWVSADPARIYENTYLYSGNTPVNLIDPDGRSPWVPILGGLVAASAASAEYGAATGDYGWKNSAVTLGAYFVGTAAGFGGQGASAVAGTQIAAKFAGQTVTRQVIKKAAANTVISATEGTLTNIANTAIVNKASNKKQKHSAAAMEGALAGMSAELLKGLTKKAGKGLLSSSIGKTGVENLQDNVKKNALGANSVGIQISLEIWKNNFQ